MTMDRNRLTLLSYGLHVITGDTVDTQFLPLDHFNLAITRYADLSSILHTRCYHSADFNTDRSLVVTSVRLVFKKSHHPRTKGFQYT